MRRLGQASFEEFSKLTKEETLERYEYIDGEIFCKPPPEGGAPVCFIPTARHALSVFDGQPCQAFAAPFDITISRYEGGHQCGAA